MFSLDLNSSNINPFKLAIHLETPESLCIAQLFLLMLLPGSCGF